MWPFRQPHVRGGGPLQARRASAESMGLRREKPSSRLSEGRSLHRWAGGLRGSALLNDWGSGAMTDCENAKLASARTSPNVSSTVSILTLRTALVRRPESNRESLPSLLCRQSPRSVQETSKALDTRFDRQIRIKTSSWLLLCRLHREQT